MSITKKFLASLGSVEGAPKLEVPQSRGYHIQELYEWFTRKELVLNPKFQRRDVWPPSAQSYLIDTVIRNMPIPKIFMRQALDVVAKKSMREVVDGQQRLRAIFRFLNDDITITKTHNPEFGGLKFSELPAGVQSRFLSYQVSTDLLVGASDEDVLEIFSRINSFGSPLNEHELLNAKYFGLFKQTVHKLGREHLHFWTDNGILSGNRILRMGEVGLVSDLIVVMLNGFPSSSTAAIKELYKKYDDEFPQQSAVVKDFREVIDKVATIFPDGIRATKFSTLTNFYSLFVLLYSLEHEVPQLPQVRIPLTSRSVPRVRRALLTANDILSNPESYPDYSEEVEASTRRTTHLISRRTRHRFLLDLVQEA